MDASTAQATSIPSPSEVTPSRPITRTKYGRSCINCSKAKCKCSYLPGKPSCERCERLNKQCKPLVSVRRGELAPAPSVPIQTSDDTRINSKLDELISLLRARQNGVTAATPIETSLVADTPDDTGSYEPLPIHLRLDPTALAEITDDVTASTEFSSATVHGRGADHHHVAIPKLPVSPEQATRCFNRFRDVMLPWLPFMHVPDTMTVSELEKTYPTLHLCVLATAATSTSQLFTWSEQLRQTMVKKMYDAGERSLDLLLAILAFIGWLRHHRQERPFFNLWLHMAITLVSDLGLDKRAQTDNTWWPWHRDSVGTEQSIEEKRAVLAVFVLSSISASSIKSVDSLQWTPHMDNCLITFEQYPEWNGDTVLGVQTRCCLITEVLNRAGQPIWPFSSSLMADTLPTAPRHSPAIHASLEAQVAELKRRVRSFGLERNPIVTMSIVTTELDIHEAIASPEKQYVPTTMNVPDKLSRYNKQLQCLKSWWDTFLSITPEHFPDVSFPVLTQLIHCIVSLFRLTMLQYPGWDRRMVKHTADITDYMQKFAGVVESTHERVGLTCDRGDDILIKTAKTMKKLRQFFLNMMMLEGFADAPPDQLPVDLTEAIPDMMDLDFWGSQWLTDMIVSWEK